jgi:hypothetical protein
MPVEEAALIDEWNEGQKRRLADRAEWYCVYLNSKRQKNTDKIWRINDWMPKPKKKFENSEEQADNIFRAFKQTFAS